MLSQSYAAATSNWVSEKFGSVLPLQQALPTICLKALHLLGSVPYRARQFESGPLIERAAPANRMTSARGGRQGRIGLV